MGSFAKASHESSIVISSRNTHNNVESSVDLPEHHCESKGDNTIHMCSQSPDGVYINDLNILHQFARLEQLVFNLSDSILPECILDGDASRPRILANCFGPTASPTGQPTGTPTSTPSLEGSTSFVGRTLLENNAVRIAANKDPWSDAEVRALFDADIQTRNQLCAAERSEFLDLGFTPGQTTDLYALFLCERSDSANVLGVGEITGIVSAAAAVLALFVGCVFKDNIKKWLREPTESEKAQGGPAEAHLLQ